MLMAALVFLGAVVPAPVVAIGRGPTYDTLGDIDGTPVVAIENLRTYPTSGQLNMTTVGVTDRLTMLRSVALWASDEYRVVPRSSVFPPELSGTEIAQRNRAQFVDSQTSAEGAALSYLGLPSKIVVEQLTARSPSAGVLEPGDVLNAVAGAELTTYRDLTDALAGTRPGEEIPVRYVRDGAAPEQAVVTLGPRPDGPQGVLGLIPGARPVDEDAIVISLADIGGPSAGLMFALAVVDKLTPGELTGGAFIAGTGTVGSIGPVGGIDGIPFKMRAARDAGATVFLVPAANCTEARSAAPDGLTLVRVDDLAGAVASLDTLRTGGSPAGC